MFRKLQTRISPASVLATVALFASLGGGAYAAATIDSSDIANNTVTGKDVKNRSITGKDISKKTVKSLRGQQGPQGPQGAQGVAGPQGPAGTALAFAQVSPSSVSLVGARTSNFASVDRPSAGLYCLTPTPAVIAQAFTLGGDPTRPSIATVEYGNTDDQTEAVSVQTRGATIECPANTLEVRTYRAGALANDVAFGIVLP